MLGQKVTLLGTMRHNRKGVPKEVKSMEGREENSTVVWYEAEKGKLSLTSYAVNTKSKGKKNIFALSSIADFPNLGVNKDDGKFKPALLKLYDMTKGGTDISDQRIESYTTNTKSRKWTTKVMMKILVTSWRVLDLTSDLKISLMRIWWLLESFPTPAMLRTRECAISMLKIFH